MPHACFLAGTTKNPIKRAIYLGKIYACKDTLGHWQIDEKTFLHWLVQRRTADRAAGQEANNKVIQPKAEAPRPTAFSSGLIADKLCDLTKVEDDAWKHSQDVPADARSVYIKHLAMIDDQKQFLKALNQIK